MRTPSPDPKDKNWISFREMIGRWMIYSAWILILLLFTVLFSNWLEHRQNPNRILQIKTGLDGNAAIILKRNDLGHYVAPGLINDEPVVFLVDTGATHVALSEELANRIGLQRGMKTISLTANGLASSRLAKLDQVQLGHIVMQDVQALIMPSMPVSEVLLGMSFLKHLELIQKGNQLIVRVPRLH